MASNKKLHSAKKEKNDEFYTGLSDIEKELMHYKDQLAGKVVFCNCDDPEESNFWRYFTLNFGHIGLKRVIATHYEREKPSYRLDYWEDASGAHTVKTPLLQNGDFRSPESIEILRQSDVIVTNPPFSLFREYVALLEKYGKQFIIIGNKNAITYEEFFPLIKDNRVWLGYNAGKGTMVFKTPDETEQSVSSYWYTNMDISKRHEKMILFRNYDPANYPKYDNDNYDAINVDKVADIPCDYVESWGVPVELYTRLDTAEWETSRRGKNTKGVDCYWVLPAAGTELRKLMSAEVDGYREAIEKKLATGVEHCNGVVGVPITFLNNYSPEQFKIIDINPHLMLWQHGMILFLLPIVLVKRKVNVDYFFVLEALGRRNETGYYM